MAKAKYHKYKVTSTKDLKYERNKLIYQYYTTQGMNLDQIGRIFKLTRERVRQIIEEYQHQQKQPTLFPPQNLTNSAEGV